MLIFTEIQNGFFPINFMFNSKSFSFVSPNKIQCLFSKIQCLQVSGIGHSYKKVYRSAPTFFWWLRTLAPSLKSRSHQFETTGKRKNQGHQIIGNLEASTTLGILHLGDTVITNVDQFHSKKLCWVLRISYISGLRRNPHLKIEKGELQVQNHNSRIFRSS